MKQQFKDNFKNPLVLADSTAAIVFIGFKPLFDLAPDGISKEVLVAGIGALFVTIVTLVLLKNQTENQTKLLQEQSRQIENQKKSEQLRGKKLETYFNALNNLNEIVKNQQLSDEDINKLRFAVLEVQLVCEPNVYKSYNEILQSLVEYYTESKSDESAVEIDDSSMETVLHLAHQFSNACRIDMDLEKIKVEGSALKNSISAGTARTEVDPSTWFNDGPSEKARQLLKGFLNDLEAGTDLKAKFTKTQISLGAISESSGKRRAVAYIQRPQKKDLKIDFAASPLILEKDATEWANRLEKNSIRAKKTGWKNFHSVTVRLAWDEWPSSDQQAMVLEALTEWRKLVEV